MKWGGVTFLILEFFCYFLTTTAGLADKVGISKRFLDLSNAYIKAEKLQCDTLFVGDSIGRQIFPPNNDKRFLTTHGGILSAGNYLLIDANIRNNKDLKTVIYITAPFIISGDFGNEKTAMNFLKPFFTYENFFKLTYVNRYLLVRPHAYIYLSYFGKFLPFDDINLAGARVLGKKRKEKTELSDFSIHYLEKMVALCEANNIELKLISPPIRRDRKVKFNGFKKMSSQVKGTVLESYFTPYLDNVFYWRNNLFSDALHLKRNFIWNKKNKMSLRKKLLNQINNN